ncbi:MAG: hypothetical protein HGA31_05820 [Candidatus Moranbacteria bacterium]|nr:hypothetical protein [Candidatus Moranbacteria bacterium]
MSFLFKTLGDFVSGLAAAFGVLGVVWYLVVPFFFPLVKYVWREYIKRVYRGGLKYVLLEMIPPKELEKSPKPMELFFSALAGTVRGFNAYDKYVDGAVPAFFTFEIVGDGGDIHFYIHTEKKFQNLVEAHLFAQYPDMEIFEVPDYTEDVPSTVPNDGWDLWGVEFEAVKPDLYPIKTYDRFEEDVTGKMVDPISGILEVMSKLPPNQKLWFQMVVWTPKPSNYAHLKDTIDEFVGKKKPKKGLFESGFIADLADVFSNVFKGIFGVVEFSSPNAKKEEQEQPIEFKLRPVQKDVLKALENNLGKQMFLVKPRMVYIGKRENFDKNVAKAFVGAINQFSDQNMNGFKKGKRSETKADFFMVDERVTQRKHRIFNRYIDRDDDPDDTSKFMSADELATIFHPPDMTVLTPTLQRVSAKRGSAPSNLPIFIED